MAWVHRRPYAAGMRDTSKRSKGFDKPTSNARYVMFCLTSWSLEKLSVVGVNGSRVVGGSVVVWWRGEYRDSVSGGLRGIQGMSRDE